MCGLCGIVDLCGGREIDPRRLLRMSSALAHRGPDGADHYRVPGVALGHRRLAIIDLSRGSQPLFNESGTVAVVFNGEVYNYRQLTRELESRGHAFRTRSDSEVLVHGWEEWGPGLVERLDGMFAFAIWDSAQQIAFLARDRTGEKPLYYEITADGFLLFASEIGSMLSGRIEASELDPEAVDDYFAYGYVPDPKSIYRGIRKLPPAHRVTFHRGRPPGTPERYWDVQFRVGVRRSDSDAAAELANRLETAVAAQMNADVPLGAFLSGGVDSSGVVAMMSRRSSTPVATCSIGFDEGALDETGFARQVAQHLGTDHTEHRVSMDCWPLVDRLALAYGEPFADSSALPTFVVSKLARGRVKVALSGDGGDEVFGGYRRYPFFRTEERARSLVPGPVRSMVFGGAAKWYPKLDGAPRWLRAKATFEALAEDSVTGYFRSVSLGAPSHRRKLYSPDFSRSLSAYDPVDILRGHARAAGACDPVSMAQYLDLKTWLPGRMLTKVDRATMSNALEVRCPLLDHRLIEWAASLPAHQRVRGFDGKFLMKRALETVLPKAILHRPKQGFSLPLSTWIREDAGGYLDRMLTPSPLMSSGMFDPAKLRALATEHRERRADHGTILWALLMFDAFLGVGRCAGEETAPDRHLHA